MMPPRRSGDLDLVDVLLGVEALRLRARQLVDTLLADAGGVDAPACDDDLVDFLLGVEVLVRAVEPPAGVEVRPVEPPISPRSERLLR
jgi:hypothetical protein